MFKRLVPLAVAALATVSMSASAAVFQQFIVNETVVPGANALGAANPALVADKLNGAYTETLTITGPGTFAASAFANFGQYLKNNGTTLTPSLLGNLEGFGGYGIYAVFSASGTVDGSSQFTSMTNSFTLYLDPLQDTTLTAPVLGTGSVTRGSIGDDIELGSASASFGTGDVVGPPGAFNIDFFDFALTPFGQTYFIDPNPFYFFVRVNGDIDGFTPTVGTTATVTGDVSAGFLRVPEPTTMALVGLALAGLGWSQRRKAG